MSRSECSLLSCKIFSASALTLAAALAVLSACVALSRADCAQCDSASFDPVFAAAFASFYHAALRRAFARARRSLLRCVTFGVFAQALASAIFPECAFLLRANCAPEYASVSTLRAIPRPYQLSKKEGAASCIDEIASQASLLYRATNAGSKPDPPTDLP